MTWLDYLAKTWGGMTRGRYSYDGENYVWSGDEVIPCRAMICEMRGMGTGEPMEANATGIVSLANLRDEILALIDAVDTACGPQTFHHPDDSVANVRKALTALREAAEKQGASLDDKSGENNGEG